ncbi:MAG: class I SAM-dependent methyltransferase [Planctomycetes bacterium]|nr:class I SAM-dependent methyltransferase [Planctomycetota bacterium]NOG54379.1 class I SAM-dependent methyltransferase [Planctomycetota bacterium]
MKSSYAHPLIAAIYDRIHQELPFLAVGPDGGPPQDAAFYLDVFRQYLPAAPHILDLGCGTGRVAFPLAQAGCRVTGLDSSPFMLEQARAKAASLIPEVRDRVEFLETDWHEYSLAAPADGAVCPFTSFQRNILIADQDQWLQCVRRNLNPKHGLLILDLFFPNIGRLAAPDEDRHPLRRFTHDGQDWIEHETVRRTTHSQIIDVTLDYGPDDGSDPVVAQQFELTWFLPREVERMLLSNGFDRIVIHGDYEGGPITDESQRQIVTASVAVD